MNSEDASSGRKDASSGLGREEIATFDGYWVIVRNFRSPRFFVPSAAAALAITALVVLAVPAFADSSDLGTVVDSVRNWVMGLLAALATLFLTIAGFRYLTAGGNPRQIEEAKDAIKSALIGYALAVLAPIFVQILRQVLHT
jgi:hypothetical protein